MVAVSALALSGCGESRAISPARAPTVCERAGQPCQLPDGPMGVCNESLAAQCDTPPCLACFSQH